MMRVIILTMFVIVAWIPASFGAEGEAPAFIYNEHGARDPFWPLVNEETGGLISYTNEVMISDMILEGIMAGSGGQNIAIINGNIIQKDSKVGQYTITQIGADFVILTDGNKSFTLKLKKEE